MRLILCLYYRGEYEKTTMDLIESTRYGLIARNAEKLTLERFCWG